MFGFYIKQVPLPVTILIVRLFDFFQMDQTMNSYVLHLVKHAKRS